MRSVRWILFTLACLAATFVWMQTSDTQPETRPKNAATATGGAPDTDTDTDTDTDASPAPGPALGPSPAPERNASEPSVEMDIRPRILWKSPLPRACMSSPRVTDLNRDGVLDIVIGTGFFEENIDASMTALDGKTGKVLWQFACPGDVFVTAELLDVNGDGTDDVLAGGRFNDLICLNGIDGGILWVLGARNPDLNRPASNFNSPILIPDMDRDGVREILVGTGGLATYRVGAPDDDHKIDAAPANAQKTQWVPVPGVELPPQEGPAGNLYVISGKSGRVLRSIESPDGREIYSVPALVTSANGERSIVFGTGGERIGGHLFRLRLKDFSEEWRHPSSAKGFVSSPILVPYPAGVGDSDSDGDGVRHDVIAASFEGNAMRLHGDTGEPIWVQPIGSEFETYSTPAPGRFNEDEYTDVAVVYAKGVWPNYSFAEIFWLDGRTGEAIARHSVGKSAYSSPLTAELNGDGYDETILAAYNGVYTDESSIKHAPGRLFIFDGRTHQIIYSIRFDGFCAATPHLSDLDRDSTLDLILPHYGEVARVALSMPNQTAKLWWNQYRGPNSDGVFRRDATRVPIVRQPSL